MTAALYIIVSTVCVQLSGPVYHVKTPYFTKCIQVAEFSNSSATNKDQTAYLAFPASHTVVDVTNYGIPVKDYCKIYGHTWVETSGFFERCQVPQTSIVYTAGYVCSICGKCRVKVKKEEWDWEP